MSCLYRSTRKNKSAKRASSPFSTTRPRSILKATVIEAGACLGWYRRHKCPQRVLGVGYPGDACSPPSQRLRALAAAANQATISDDKRWPTCHAAVIARDNRVCLPGPFSVDAAVAAAICTQVAVCASLRIYSFACFQRAPSKRFRIFTVRLASLHEETNDRGRE